MTEANGTVQLDANVHDGYDIAQMYPTNHEQKFAYCIGTSGKTTPPRLYIVEAPAKHKNSPLCSALINHLNQTQQNKPTANYGKYRDVVKIFDWINASYTTEQELPSDIIEKYSNHLKTTGIKQASQCQYIMKLRVAINWGMNNLFSTPEFKNEHSILSNIFSYIPSIPNNRESTRESLSEITNNSCSDELKLVRSVIRFCCHFLIVVNRLRAVLNKNEEVKKQLKLMLTKHKNNVEKLKWANKGKDFKVPYKALAKAVLDSNDLLLKDYLLSNRNDFQETLDLQQKTLTLEEANQFIKNGLTAKDNLNYASAEWPAPFIFTNIDFLFLIKPTQAEEICMSWLLGADRIQLSGIENLKMSDIMVTPSSASIYYLKKRSNESTRETVHHGHRTLQYRAIADYTSLRQNYLDSHPQENAMFFEMPTCGSLQVIDSDVFRPLIVAALPNSRIYAYLKECHAEISPFAEIIENISRNNSILQEKSALSTAVRSNRYSGEAIPNRLKEINQIIESQNIKRQSITVNKIAQSRAILDNNKTQPHATLPVSDSALKNISAMSSEDNYEKFSQEFVGAISTAHAPDTKQTLYINRSNTDYRWEKRASFARAVGEMMEADARKINELRDSNRYVSISELQIELGWKVEFNKKNDIDEFDAVIEELQSRGWSVTPFGELESNGHHLIIVSPIEAALLLSYRNACESRLNELSEYEQSRASALLMQIAYIEAVLEKFDQKTIFEGEEILNENDFPSPIIQ
ncbi:hypothetical protein [Pseudomonas putida]|uniref:hypothetical protein n=1 Tax=Pseudomonas putida TaxID=303 RepID=UPI0022DD8BE2|nr:hypothetical protein [Pseudomonas putida]WBM44670.1 hypothetical protein M2J85_18210 [Pseudomonas putida]